MKPFDTIGSTTDNDKLQTLKDTRVNKSKRGLRDLYLDDESVYE
jgi:hypothetical protein